MIRNRIGLAAWKRAGLAAVLAFLVGCLGQPVPPGSNTTDTSGTPNQMQGTGDGQTDDWFYVLQPGLVSQAELAAAGFRWLVMDPTRDGDAASAFSRDEVETIRAGGACRKIVLAYLSIGEAENYRDYWRAEWIDGSNQPVAGTAPGWLGPFNPNYPSNYKVRYWDPEWQGLLFGTPSGPDRTPLDAIIDAGFDGVYLDIVDAYEFWSEPEGGNELTRLDARRRMIDLIVAIGTYARQTRGVSGFREFPQNAAGIIRDDDDAFDNETERYFAAISGIGQEDLFYDELTEQPVGEVEYALDQLREFGRRNKTVLVTDYVIDVANPGPSANSARVSDFVTRCRAEGFIPYAANRDRDLDEIVQLDSGWPFQQPVPGCP